MGNKRILAATAVDTLRALLGRGKLPAPIALERGLALRAAIKGNKLPLATYNANKWLEKNAVSMGWLRNLRSNAINNSKLTGAARTELEQDWASVLRRYDGRRLRR